MTDPAQPVSDTLIRPSGQSPAHAPAAAAVDSSADTLCPPRAAEPTPPVRRSRRPDARPEGVSHFEITGVLGRGGMGVVYRATDTRLNRPVALKMVLAGEGNAADLTRFRSEAEAVARLQHPNVVQIYEVGESDGRPYLALELIDGPTLQHVLSGTPQPVENAARLVETLALAVHAAHAKGVVHRDLKPGNILLAPAAGTPYGSPKITDFGLAKRLGEDNCRTQSGDMLGTPSYMAPEQAAGNAHTVGPAADVYSLGAILYECLTGRPPFKGASAAETVRQVIDEEPVPPGRLRPKLPRDLERVCLKCLEKDPSRRYATAAELADDLARHLRGEDVSVRPAGPAERVARWVRRNPLAAALFAGVVVAAAAGMWYLSWVSRKLVESAAVESAAQQSRTLDEVNRYYAGIVANLKGTGVEARADWAGHPGRMPIPATFTIELGEVISESADGGVRFRLISEYPFRSRKDRPPLDEFQVAALAALREKPDAPFYRFEDYDGVPSLRYATARKMQPSCVNCHNRDPDSPKTDWRDGDVRGALEVIRPLGRDADRVHRGLRGAFLLVGFGLAAVPALWLGAALLRRRSAKNRAEARPEAAPAVAPTPEPGVAPESAAVVAADRSIESMMRPSARELCEFIGEAPAGAARDAAMDDLASADPALHAFACDLGPDCDGDRRTAALKRLAAKGEAMSAAAPLVRGVLSRAMDGVPTDGDVFALRAALAALDKIAADEDGTFRVFLAVAAWQADGATCRHVRETALGLLGKLAAKHPSYRAKSAEAAGAALHARGLAAPAARALAACGPVARAYAAELRRLATTAPAFVKREVEAALRAME